jgi:hypothetical protein
LSKPTEVSKDLHLESRYSMSTSRRYVNKLLCFYICMYTGVIHCATCRKYILNKILNLYFCLKFTNSLEKRPIIYIILFQLAQHIMYERFVTLYSTTGLCESTYVTALSQEVSIPRLTEICDRVKFHNADMKHGVRASLELQSCRFWPESYILLLQLQYIVFWSQGWALPCNGSNDKTTLSSYEWNAQNNDSLVIHILKGVFFKLI